MMDILPLLDAITALEQAFRKIHPLTIIRIREGLLVHVHPLETQLQKLTCSEIGIECEHTRHALMKATELAMDAISTFGTGDDAIQAFMSILKAMRKHCQAQETLFQIRNDFIELNRYFLEPSIEPIPMRHALKEQITGIMHSGSEDEPYARGVYSLFIPENYTSERSWPLIVALHGGYGHGRDYIWIWLREARSRGLVLLAPSSLGRTWSICNIAQDVVQLDCHVKEVCSRFNINRNRVLLTGMSDGGTFALGAGIFKGSMYEAIAPVSCVLPPADLGHVGGKRIYWVHGEHDWMFPVGRAMKACKDLSLAGADVKLKILPDLSHAYPREENNAILRWFDPDLVPDKPA